MRRRKSMIALAVAATLAITAFAATALAATTVSLGTRGACCKFNKSTINATRGTLTINFRNSASGVPHNVGVKGKGVRKISRTITSGTTTLRVRLSQRGTYTFFCAVPTHESQGMKGRLTVR
jgi:plastocyanin